MILIISTAIIFGFLWYVYHKLTFWQRQGVPTPGLLYQWHYYRRELGPYDLELHKKLGPVYGIYEGLSPILIVGDPDLIRLVLAKEFHNFPNHKTFRLGEPTFDQNLFSLDGSDDWKRIRSIVSPTFTSGKLRAMDSIIVDCTEKLKSHLKKAAESGEAINVRKFYNSLSFGIILRCAYGAQVDILDDPANPILNNMENIFTGEWYTYFTLYFPKMSTFLGLNKKGMEPLRFFENMSRKLIDERKGSTRAPSNDFLQLMIDANREIVDGQKEIAGSESAKKGISDVEMMAQALVFLIGGFDTTATIMACCAYHLAKNPEVQEKLIEELSQVEELNHDTVKELKYLNAVLKESFRLSPPGIRVERQCVAATRLGQITVLPGTIVSVPVFAVQRDPKQFSNPDVFDPNRFLEGGSDVNHHEYAYLPFGGGPRICIAQRFAHMEIKMALALILKSFSFEATPETKLTYAPMSMDNLAPNEIMLRIQAR